MRLLIALAALAAATPVWAQDDPIVIEGDLGVTSGIADDEP